MLACALDNFRLVVVDVDTRRLVRMFTGHSSTITDLVTRLTMCADTIGTVPVPCAGHFQC